MLKEQLPPLETERLRLRWLTQRDSSALFEIFGDPVVMRYWSRPAMKDPLEAAALVDEIHACFASHTLYQWGIARKEDDRVIGTVTLAEIDPTNARAELGYSLSRSVWGQGLALEAVSSLLDFSFDHLALNRIEADIDPRNVRSIALMDRLGFAREGLMRARHIVAGEVQDTLMFGLLAADWRRERTPKDRSENPPQTRDPVRRMIPADREVVLDLLGAQLAEHQIPIQASALAAAVDGALCRPERGAFLVADLGRGPVGVAYLGFTWTVEHGGRAAWLEELYVRPAHRGLGIGEKLLQSAITWLKERGFRGFDLEVDSGHARASHLYQRAGFRPLPRARFQRSLL